MQTYLKDFLHPQDEMDAHLVWFGFIIPLFMLKCAADRLLIRCIFHTSCFLCTTSCPSTALFQREQNQDQCNHMRERISSAVISLPELHPVL